MTRSSTHQLSAESGSFDFSRAAGRQWQGKYERTDNALPHSNASILFKKLADTKVNNRLPTEVVTETGSMNLFNSIHITDETATALSNLIEEAGGYNLSHTEDKDSPFTFADPSKMTLEQLTSDEATTDLPFVRVSDTPDTETEKWINIKIRRFGFVPSPLDGAPEWGEMEPEYLDIEVRSNNPANAYGCAAMGSILSQAEQASEKASAGGSSYLADAHTADQTVMGYNLSYTTNCIVWDYRHGLKPARTRRYLNLLSNIRDMEARLEKLRAEWKAADKPTRKRIEQQARAQKRMANTAMRWMWATVTASRQQVAANIERLVKDGVDKSHAAKTSWAEVILTKAQVDVLTNALRDICR